MIQTSWIANPWIKSPPEPGQPTEAIPVREAAQLKLPSHGWKIPDSVSLKNGWDSGCSISYGKSPFSMGKSTINSHFQ